MPELRWAQDTFSTEQTTDDIWHNWIKTTNCSNQELLKIIYGQFQEEYQKRALFLLLVPDTRLALFLGWRHREPFHCLNTELDFRKVETGLRAHAVYWLTKFFIDYARYEPALKDQRAVLLDAYNKYILQLLAVLPAEDNQAETLFQYFSVNDPNGWSDDGNGSGYKPLLALWKNPQINEHWKRLAETEVRKIIKSELRGESVPREPWENALQCYAAHLQSLLSRDGKLPYSKEFLAEQLDWLTSLEVYDQQLLRPESIALILPLFTKERERYKGMWNRLVRFVVLQDGNFKIYNEQTEEAAEMILKECDPQIHVIVQDQLNAYQQIINKIKQETEEKTKIKETLLAPMRKPATLPPNEDQSEQ